jgi:hypothetical protein
VNAALRGLAVALVGIGAVWFTAAACLAVLCLHARYAPFPGVLGSGIGVGAVIACLGLILRSYA